MKKIVILVLMATLLMVLPAQAQSVDLTSLAHYLPTDVPIYIAANSSAGSIETVDSLASRLSGIIGMSVGSTPFSDLLDSEVQYMDSQSDFDSLVRPWLGDTIAMAVISPTQFIDDGELYLFVSVTDELRARKYLNLALENSSYADEYTISEYAGGTLYLASEDVGWNDSYWLTSDVLVVADSSYDGFLYEPPSGDSLADNPKFNDTVALLPEDNYGAMMYLDTQAILQILDEMGMSEAEGMFPGMNVSQLQEAIGAQAWGFGLMRGRHLTIDFAQHISLGVLEAAGFPMSITGPVDPAFAQYIPADSALVLHDTQLGETISQTLDTLAMMGEIFGAEQQRQLDDWGYASDELTTMANLDEMAAFLRLSYKGLSGSSLEDSTAWMTGDYAAYIALPLVDDVLSVDIGAVTTVTDAAAAAAFSQSLQNILDAWGADYTVDGQVVTFSALRQLAERMQAMEMGAMMDLPDLDILFGYNDSVFAIGTRPGVENALNGGSSLADSEAYQVASEVFLPDTQAIAYVDTQILTAGLYEMDSRANADTVELANILGEFESASITADYSEDGIGIVRFVLTLPN
ncbi:MAG: hypothetical protein H6670_12155 [Anaerolineaceae bacterium]|nr:hypothetical protein [Anaerolineaceae bacterium]